MARTSVLLLLLLGLPAVRAQTIQLNDGQVLLATIEDVDGQGLRVKRLDNGGVLELRWDHLSAESAQRIKAAHDLGGTTDDEVMVSAESVSYMLNGARTEVIGRIVERTPTDIKVARKGVIMSIAKDAGPMIKTIEVPATQVFTREEYYSKRLNDVQPGESADKHMQLAQELIKVRDYDHAKEHLDTAQKLGNSKEPDKITQLMRRLETFRENQNERNLIDEIQVARSRGEFDKGLKLIDDYKTKYAQGRLRSDFEGELKRFTEARERVLSGRVAEQWRRLIISSAERKVGEAGLTLAQAKEFATSKMGEELCQRTAQQLQLKPEEVRSLWQGRAKYPTAKHAEMFSYGIGTWVLDEKAILKDTKQGKAAQAPPKDPAQDREIERIKQLIKTQRDRSRQNSGDPKAKAKPEVTDEDWWRSAQNTERAGWLRAYYAESSGDLVLVSAYLQDCPTCAGEGTVPEVVDGKVVKQPCFLCHGKKYLRSFTAY